MNASIASIEQAREIAALFDIPQPIKVHDFPLKGNINRETFLVVAGPPGYQGEYLLQLLNPEVFSQPRAVMEAMNSCIQAQQRALSQGVLGENEEWEPIQLIPARDGKRYLELLHQGECRCWRMMKKISNVRCYRSLRAILDITERYRVAYQAGRGLALFGIMTASMDADTIDGPFPGYRNTCLYYDQLASVLAGCRTPKDANTFLPIDPVLRENTQEQFLIHLRPDEYQRRLKDPQIKSLIDLAFAEKAFALMLQEQLQQGKLRKRIVHGDTKLENFLFSASSGKVKALVDLDTVMAHTWLSDWGDLARSIVNTAGETEPDPDKIEIDLEILKALAKGFLGTARFLEKYEINLMAEAAQIMALELGVRFLADYLRGDSYFKITLGQPPDLNKTRAMVQFTLFEKLRRQTDSARQYIKEALGG